MRHCTLPFAILSSACAEYSREVKQTEGEKRTIRVEMDLRSAYQGAAPCETRVSYALA